MEPLFSLKGKTALVTGGGRGIGAALADGLQKHGASVAVFECNMKEGAFIKGIKYYDVDISNRHDLKSNFEKFINDLAGIDILVNNAGITLHSPSEDYPENFWDKSVEINLSAVFLLCKMSGQYMIKQRRGGSIINVTSIGAVQGFPNNPAYVATKGAVRQLTKGLAYDWGKYNIRVNNLAPGYTHTPMNRKSWDDPALRAERAGRTFLGRWAEPEDMIGPVVFLASDASSYVTGTDLHVDGGWSAKGI